MTAFFAYLLRLRYILGRLAVFLFVAYLAVFPGSTIVVALDRVPEWGAWMGGALLLLQGAVALCWLVGVYGARGGLAALLIFLLAWAVEHIGVLAGMPFGRYRYTDALQPQILSTVPLAIPCAWLMVATGAWQLARMNLYTFKPSNLRTLVVAATLVLLLDLQIETVATKINQYWIWLDSGQYYGVPAANFVAWWLVGLAMALVVANTLPERGDRAMGRRGDDLCLASGGSRLWSRVASLLPAYLYLLSTLMFATVNLARGYTMAGIVGVVVLLGAALAALPPRVLRPLFPGMEQSETTE
jgi:putative membrane protein